MIILTNEQFELLLNPVRLRILQYMAVHRTGVPREMAAYLTDVPLPSLYRHLGKLTEGGVLEVAGEKKVRGTVEKTYQIAEDYFAPPSSKADVYRQIYLYLTMMLKEVSAYCAQEESDPAADMLFLDAISFYATDKEYSDYLEERARLDKKMMENEWNQERKHRSLTVLSLPSVRKGNRI